MANHGAGDHTSTAKSDDLCPRCTNLNINELWSSIRDNRPLGTIETWNPNLCTLCKFLLDLLPPELASQRSQPYFLYSVRSRESSEPLIQLLETRLLVLSTSDHGLPPKGIPYMSFHPTKNPFWLKPIQPLIDFDQLKDLLDVCKELHTHHCAGNPGDDVDDLQLIDCTTGEVVRAKEKEEYVALSYVWGHNAEFQQKPGKYPKTIQDAIVATKRLGYVRLWVDQYCLDQKNRTEFHKQLQQMDAIYKQAAVTIIAAAGVDANHGLPGVSDCLRAPTSSVNIDGKLLSPVHSKLDLESETCRWMTRAWTFQEGLLSTRRLIFTENQVYFECRGMYCTEMVNIPKKVWKQMHHREHPYLISRYRIAPLMGMFPLDGCGVDPWDIYSRISEYSDRNLTHQADILNGMLGIFRNFERNKNSLRQIYGLPFAGMSESSPNELIALSGSKNEIPIFSESLRWTLKTPGARREGFPSWSWTGWFGEVLWPAGYIGATFPRRVPRKIERPHDPKVNGKAIKLAVELRDGTVIDWKTFQTRYRELHTSGLLSGFLRLEAYTTPAVYMHEANNAEVTVGLLCENGQNITLQIERTAEHEPTAPDPLLAIHFCRTVSKYREESSESNSNRGKTKSIQHLLIVQDRGSHWERVAVVACDGDLQKQLQRNWQCLRMG